MTPSFDTLADFLPEPMALVTPAGMIRSANGALAALVGRNKSSLIDQGLSDIGLSSPDGWPDYLRRCAGTRTFFLGAATHLQSDGSELFYRCEGALYAPQTGTGEPLVLLRLLPRASSSSRFVALTQKVAELSAENARRQRAEQEAREGRELLYVTLSSIGDGVIATDRGGRVTFMNHLAERLTGWTQSDAVQVHVSEIFRIVNEDTREAVANPVEKVLASGKIVGLANHTVLIGRDGTERPIDDSGAPIVDASGQVHGVVLVFRDVAELRAAQRQQEAARKAAEDANRAKDEFLATLSHELRTPLNAILGWSRMLIHGAFDDARRAHALHVIHRNAEIQARLVEDLLDMSRITTGQLRLRYEPIDLQQIINAAIDSIRPAVDNKSLRLTASVRLTSAVQGDPTRLQQVIWNLLTNAVKFTPPHGVITIEAAEENGLVRIVVTDSGEGIPAPFTSRIFDAFTQVDGSIARPYGGLGVGLTIVRRLVEAHGGHVEAESAGPNQGATFTVTLPVAPQQVPATQPALPSLVRDLHGCRVLIVEDHVDSSELAKFVLEAAGATVVTRRTARQALDAIERGRFDVLVADIGLPREDGVWLIQQVRKLARDEHRTMPAVAVSAFVSSRHREDILAAGYDEYVSKPLDVEALLGVLRRLRGRHPRAPGEPFV